MTDLKNSEQDFYKSADLLPCPHCGSKAERKADGAHIRYIACTNKKCMCCSCYHQDIDEVISRWNYRTTDAKLEKAIDFIDLLSTKEGYFADEARELLKEFGDG